MNLNGTIKKTQALTGRLVKSSGGGGSVQEIYWVQYGVGTATNAEVNEAVAANKLPICYFDSTNAYGQATRTLYFLVRHTPTEAFFATVLPTTKIIEVKRLYADAFNTEIIRYEGKLTWDTTPRFGSVNPVTSGGIYNAIQNATVSDERIAEAVDDWLSVQAPSIGTLSYAAKQALLACFRHVAWIDDQGQSYYDTLERELISSVTVDSITAVFTQGSAIIYDIDSLDTLKQYLAVTANYSDSTTATVTDYTLSGTLTAGTSTITVSYGGKSDTFSASVTGTVDDGTFSFADGTAVTILNDHVTVVVGSNAGGRFINLSHLSSNTSDPTNSSNVNNKSTTFMTIASGKTATAMIKNVASDNTTWRDMSSTQVDIAMNLRKQNATTSIMSPAPDVVPRAFTSSNGTHIEAKLNDTQTYTASASVVASCLFAYIGGNFPNGTTIEFDIAASVS